MKVIKFGSYYVLTILYSILIGVVGWSFLYIVNTVVHFLWIGHEGNGAFMYEHKLLIFPFIFGVSMFLAYLYNNFEVIPRPGIAYAKEFKENQTVQYNDFVKIYLMAMIPLFLGSSVGPEAALVGLFFMLSSYIGEATDRFEKRLGVEIIEDHKDRFIDNLKANPLYMAKIAIIYVVVGFTLLELLNLDRFPSFNVAMEPVVLNSVWQLVEVLPLLIVGYALAKFYKLTEHPIDKIFSSIENQYLKLGLTATILSLFALCFPLLITSGEATLHILVEHPIIQNGILLILFALLKVLITHICISGDLRGGHIFPIIYSSFLMGFGISQIFGLDPTLSIAAVTSAMTMTIFSNNIAIFLLLALFFPIPILSVIFVIALLIGEKRAADEKRDEL